MIGHTQRPADERGMETVVSHVLSIGITTLLIIGLVATATGFLDGQRDEATRSELATISERLASDLMAADRLGRSGDEVELRTSLPGRVAGSTYTATLLGGGCSLSSQACLRLSAAENGHTSLIALRNETNLTLQSGIGGEFRITSDGGGSSGASERRPVELSTRVGIGHDVGVGANLGPGGGFSQAPIPDFRWRPDRPQTGEQITFDASGSVDPDGTIVTYEWDFNGNGSVDLSSPSPTADYTYTSPGSYNVTLRVIDSAAISSNLTQEIDISGLEYNEDMSWTGPGDPQKLVFTVTNQYSQPIAIERILIDPADTSSHKIDGKPELEIDRGPDGTNEGFVNWTGGMTPEVEGRIVDIDEAGSSQGSDVSLSAGEDAEISLNFSSSALNDEYTFGVRYRIGSSVGSNVFNDTVDNP